MSDAVAAAISRQDHGSMLGPATTATPTEAMLALRARRKRKKLWEIEPEYHCTVVGNCLPPATLARAARSSGLPLPDGLPEYEEHGIMVANVRTRNPFSIRVQRLLDQTHATSVAAAATARSSEALVAWWEAEVERGFVSGPYWALMSHADADDEARIHAFGQVHMMAHEACASTRRAHVRGKAAERALAEARSALEREREALISARQLIDNLAHERDAQHADSLAQRARADALERALAEARAPGQARQDDVAAHDARATEAARDTGSIEQQHARERRRLLDRLREQKRRRREAEFQLEALRASLASTSAPNDAHDEGVDSLAGRRIAYVGGHAGSAPQLRAAVEARGAEFLYHDAGLEQHDDTLARTLRKAEVVFCPVSCVSHAACLRAKRFCRRRARKFVPLRSAGVSSFVQALNALTPEPATMAR